MDISKLYTDFWNTSIRNRHELYKDGDKDIPDVICDRNGQIVLSLCKNCGLAEIELIENINCEYGEHSND